MVFVTSKSVYIHPHHAAAKNKIFYIERQASHFSAEKPHRVKSVPTLPAQKRPW